VSGLSVAALVGEAAERSGAWPGEVPFAGTLELLVASSMRTGKLNATGLEVLHKAAVRHLRNIRHLQDYVDAHPDVVARPLGNPVVVTGLPRTGTTLLHNLLALDPHHRVLRFWEALHPIPPGAGGPAAELLQAQAQRWLDAFRRLVPAFEAIHRATVDGPEECDALLQNSFASQHFDDMFDARDYSAWMATAPLTCEYEHFALQLRVLSTGDAPGTSWALKSPSHLGHLDALSAALPGATVLVCHRHPREAVASYASLISALRRAYSDTVSPEVVGRQALTRAATAMQRALSARDDSTVIDVSYRGLVRDPVGEVAAIYNRLGRSFDPDAVAAWAAAHPQHAHGPHRHDLAQFGLTGQEVDAAFAPYLDRFAAFAG